MHIHGARMQKHRESLRVHEWEREIDSHCGMEKSIQLLENSTKWWKNIAMALAMSGCACNRTRARVCVQVKSSSLCTQIKDYQNLCKWKPRTHFKRSKFSLFFFVCIAFLLLRSHASFGRLFASSAHFLSSHSFWLRCLSHRKVFVHFCTTDEVQWEFPIKFV